MNKTINIKLSKGDIEKAWFWLTKNNINKKAIAMHFKISVESLNRQLGIKPIDPLMEALKKLGNN